MSFDTSFLSPSLRKVVALLLSVGGLLAGGAVADSRIRGIAAEEARKATEPAERVSETRLDEVLRRLERIERKLDK